MQKKIIFIGISLILVGGYMKSERNNQNCENGVCSLIDQPDAPIAESVHDTQESIVIELNADTFNTTITTAKKPVIVDFYATWCPPCKQVKPFFTQLAQEETDWLFYAVDVDKAPSVAAECSISAMPTFAIFQHGVQWGTVKGALPKEQLKIEFQKIIDSPTPHTHISANQDESTRQLITTIIQRNLDGIKKLVQEGADVNGSMEIPGLPFKCFILQTAIISGNESIIDFLLESGAMLDSHVQEETKKHLAYFQDLIEKRQQELTYAMTKSEGSPLMPHEVIQNQELGQQFMQAIMNPELLKELFAKNVDVNCAFTFGQYEVTPVYLAFSLSNRTAMDMLIEAGASFAAIVNTEYGQLPVCEAIKKESDTMEAGIVKSKERLRYALEKAGL